MTGRRTRSWPALAALAAALSPPCAQAVTSPAYGGLVYPERPVAAIPLLAGLSVNTLTGNMLLGRSLVTVPGRGVPFEAFIVYNSDRRRIASPFGKGWTFSYAMRYVDDAAGNVRLIWGDGRVDLFLAAGGGAFTSPAGLFATLSRPAPGQFVLRSKHGLEYRFLDASHRKLTQVADPSGNTLVLAYDPLARLERVTDAAGRHWDLTYDGKGRVTSLSDANLPRSFSFAYDAQDRLIALTDPLGNAESFGYGVDDLLTSVTDRRGDTATFSYSAPQGPEGSRLLTGVSKGGSSAQVGYDAASRSTTLTDANGGGWQYAYSPSDLLIAATDSLGESETFMWGTDKVLLEHTDRRGTASTFDYDGQGNLTHATVPLTTITNAVTALTYDPTCNRPATLTDPRGSTWAFTYDTDCGLTTITDPVSLGTSASVARDAMGQPVGFTDRSGRTTAFAYDAAGNSASVSDALGRTWEYDHDGGGRLVGTEDPLGNQLAFAYDALDRLVAATDALGHDATYEYDEAGNLTRFTDREGNQTQATYDALGRLAGTTDALGHADANAYDAAGNVTMYTDRRGEHWLSTFDAAHRIVGRTNPLGSSWAYGYDANGNLATHTSALGQVTISAYDLADRLVQQDFANGIRVTHTWDAGGNLVASRDANPNTSAVYGNYTYAYDAAGRRTAYTDLLQAKSVAYGWDGDGRMVSKSLPSGDVTQYGYDAAGRLTGIAAFGDAAVIVRDAAGRVVEEQRASGVTSSYTRDANGRLSAAVITAPAPPPAPAHATAAPGGGVLASWSYTRDLVGRITATVRETLEHVAYTRDPLGRIVTEQGDHAATGPYTLTQAFDANGNRTERTFVTTTSTQSRTVAFDAASLAATLTATDGGAAAVLTFTRNANGAETRVDRDNPPGTRQTFYDARNRPFQLGLGASARTFSWDQFDRLTFSQRGAETFRVMYGSDKPVQTLSAGGIADFAQCPGSGPGGGCTCGAPLPRGWRSGDCQYSARSGGEVIDLIGGDDLDGAYDSCGGWSGCGESREIGLATGDDGAVVGRCDWYADGEEQACGDPVPYGVARQLGANGECDYEFNDGTCVARGSIHDLFAGGRLNPGGTWGASWSAGDAGGSPLASSGEPDGPAGLGASNLLRVNDALYADQISSAALCASLELLGYMDLNGEGSITAGEDDAGLEVLGYADIFDPYSRSEFPATHVQDEWQVGSDLWPGYGGPAVSTWPLPSAWSGTVFDERSPPERRHRSPRLDRTLNGAVRVYGRGLPAPAIAPRRAVVV